MKTSSDRGSMNPVQFAFWALVIVFMVLAITLSSCSSNEIRQATLFKVEAVQGEIVCTSYVYSVNVPDVQDMIEASPNQYYDMDYTVDTLKINEVVPINAPFEYIPAQLMN